MKKILLALAIAMTVTSTAHASLAAKKWVASDEAKTPWRNEPLAWETFHGIQVPSPATVTWVDEGTPWAVFTVADVAYNVDVSEYVQGSGL